MQSDHIKIKAYHEEFLKEAMKIEHAYINGDLNNKVPNILNISFNFVEGESLIMGLKDIAVSSGSACTSASLEPSYVLRALGRKDELAHSSIRFSFGRFTSDEDIKNTLSILNKVVDRLRELSPLWEMHLDGIDLDTVKWNTH
jgi:cysteine desulfurase